LGLVGNISLFVLCVRMLEANQGDDDGDYVDGDDGGQPGHLASSGDDMTIHLSMMFAFFSL